MLRLSACIALSLFPVTTPASAALITRTFDVFADNLMCACRNPTYSDVSGSFTVTFDPTKTVVDDAGVILNALSVPHVGPVVFSYDKDLDLMIIGGEGSTSSLGEADFFLGFSNPLDPANPSPSFPSSISFTVKGEINSYLGFRPSIVARAAGAVPEPVSWAMMVGGLGLIGYAMRRRPYVAMPLHA